jgi:transcriptional regulator with XRE-family HTH domain
MTITAAQLKASRQLLGWSQDDVASASGLSTETVVYFEHGTLAPKPRDLADIRMTLEAAGIAFGGRNDPYCRPGQGSAKAARLDISRIGDPV